MLVEYGCEYGYEVGEAGKVGVVVVFAAVVGWSMGFVVVVVEVELDWLGLEVVLYR